MTKPRERWTDEEHEKFLEALKLHGRQWRKIEGKTFCHYCDSNMRSCLLYCAFTASNFVWCSAYDENMPLDAMCCYCAATQSTLAPRRPSKSGRTPKNSFPRWKRERMMVRRDTYNCWFLIAFAVAATRAVLIPDPFYLNCNCTTCDVAR